eukprot:12673554-Heterocapsa_arctica.AAC.1
MHSINHFPAAAQRRTRSRCCSRSSRGSRCPAATACPVALSRHFLPYPSWLEGRGLPSHLARAVTLHWGR